MYADGTTHKSLEDVVKKFSAQKIPVNYLLSGAKSGNVYRHLDSGTRNLGTAIRSKLKLDLVANNEDSNSIVLTNAQLGEAICICVFEMAGFKQHTIKRGFEKLVIKKKLLSKKDQLYVT